MEDSNRAQRKLSWISFDRYQLAWLKLLKEVSSPSTTKCLEFMRFLSEILISVQLASVILIFSIDVEGYENSKGFISALYILRPDYLAISKMLSFYDQDDQEFRGFENISHLCGVLVIVFLSLVHKLKLLSNKLFTSKFGMRNDLSLDIMEEMTIFFILFLCIYLPRAHMTYAITGIPAIWMIKCYYTFLPSHSERENFMKISRYLLVANICASYYIALIWNESSFIFLSLLLIYPVLVFIANFKTNARVQKIQNSEEFEEEEWELNIRMNKNLKRERNFKDFIKWICLRQGNNLKIALIESKFYAEVFKNYSLSMLKLAKMIHFTKFAETNILKQTEIMFETYCHFDYLLSKMNQQDQKLIQLGLEMNYINNRDIRTCRQLLDFLQTLSFEKLFSGFQLLKSSQEMMDNIRDLRRKYKLLLREFPGEIEFFDSYTSFKEILKKECNKKLAKKTFIKKDLTTANFQCGKTSETPQIIMQADPLNIGKIIYMNLVAKNYLKYKKDCKHLKNIIPSVRKKWVNRYLRELFFETELTEHEFPCYCFKRSDGFLILVKAKIILTWHNFRSYFILSFIIYPRQIDYFIADQKDSILEYGKSFLRNVDSIEELKFYCLKNAKDHEIAYFHHGYNYIGFIKTKLAIYRRKVYLVMLFIEETMFEKVKKSFTENQNMLSDDNDPYLEQMICILPSSFSQTIDQNNTPVINYREMVEEDTNYGLGYSNSQYRQRQECFQIVKKAFSFYTRPIRIGIKIVFLIYFLTSTTVICLTEFGIHEIEKNIAIDELGKMRALTQQIVTNTRSLLLMNEGYEMEFSEETYRSILQSSSHSLKDLVSRFQDEVAIDILLKKKLFTENTVHVYDRVHGQIDESDLYLSESLRVLVDKAVAFESYPLQNLTDYYYILRNGPTDILTVLNSTVYEALEITLQRIDAVEYIYTILCALVFIPSVIMIIVATPAVKYFETINKSFSRAFAKMKNSSISQLGGAVQERLVQMFDDEVLVDYGSKPCDNTISIWTLWRYTIGLISAATIASYCLITLIYPTQIFSIIKQQPMHDFWYGYSRMIPMRSFYWSREAYLDSEGTNSYVDIFWDGSPVTDLQGKTLEVAEEYSFLLKNVNFILKDSYKYKLDEYKCILYGRACELLTGTISHCEKSLVAKGIYLGALDFIKSVESVGHMSKTGDTDWVDIRKLEENANILTSSCAKLMDIVTNSSEDILVELISTQIILSSFVFVILGVFMFYVMKIGLLKVADQMFSKIKIASIIDDDVLISLTHKINNKKRY